MYMNELAEIYVYFVIIDMNLVFKVLDQEVSFYVCFAIKNSLLPHYNSVNINEIMQLYLYLVFVFFQENDFDLYFLNRVRRFHTLHREIRYPCTSIETAKFLFLPYYEIVTFMVFVNDHFYLYYVQIFEKYVLFEKIHGLLFRIFYIIYFILCLIYEEGLFVYFFFFNIYLLHKIYYLYFLNRDAFEKFYIMVLNSLRRVK